MPSAASSMRVTVFGRASHTAAARTTGVNAIALAAKAILALEKDIDRHHPSVGKPVISINQISGGVAHNVVPGECEFTIDRRLIPGETRESVVDEITETLTNVAVPERGEFRFSLTVDPDGDFIPANITEPDSPLVQAVWDATRDVSGEEPDSSCSGPAPPTGAITAWPGSTPSDWDRVAKTPTAPTRPSSSTTSSPRPRSTPSPSSAFWGTVFSNTDYVQNTVRRLTPSGISRTRRRAG